MHSIHKTTIKAVVELILGDFGRQSAEQSTKETGHKKIAFGCSELQLLVILDIQG